MWYILSQLSQLPGKVQAEERRCLPGVLVGNSEYTSRPCVQWECVRVVKERGGQRGGPVKGETGCKFQNIGNFIMRMPTKESTASPVTATRIEEKRLELKLLLITRLIEAPGGKEK